MRAGFVFHGNRVLEIDLSGQSTCVKSYAVFLDMNSLRDMHLKASKHKFIADFHPKLNIVGHHVFFAVDAGQQFQRHKV